MGKASRKKRKGNPGASANESNILVSSKDSVTLQNKKVFQKLTAKAIFSLVITVILLSSFVVYFNSLFNGFVYDDRSQVIENRWITDIKYIPEIFFKHAWGFQNASRTSNYYRPFVHLIYMVNYHIFGLKPWGLHLVNILFHAGVSILVFIIALRLLSESPSASSISSLTPPFMAALLFTTHPIHTEAVTWVAGLPDVSFTFFYFLSFYFYIRTADNNLSFKGTYLLSVASFFLATLCKETALTLPLILLAYDYTFRRGEVRLTASLKKYIPYIIVTGVYFILRFHALKDFAPLKHHAELSTYEYFINILPLFMQYLGKLILPINLNAFYVLHPIASLFEAKGILSLIIIMIFISLTFVAFRKNKVVFLGLLFIIVPLLPVIYIPVLGEATFAERYLYISSFGVVILLASLINWAKVKKPAAVTILTVISILIAGLYSVETVNRNTIWKDDFILSSDMVKKSPDGAFPRSNLGLYLQQNGKIDEAIEQLQIAIMLSPGYADAHNNLGVAFSNKGLIDKAIEQYQIALKLNPDHALSHKNLVDAEELKNATFKAKHNENK